MADIGEADLAVGERDTLEFHELHIGQVGDQAGTTALGVGRRGLGRDPAGARQAKRKRRQQQARDGHDELHAGLLGARARSIASARGAEARARVTKLRGVFPPLRGGKESRYCSPTIRPRAVTTTQRPSWRLISSTRPTPGRWSPGSISIMP